MRKSFLYTQRNRLYFRRRIPTFSTTFAPILISLGTTDENLALKLVEQLVTEFDRMLDGFLFVRPELPAQLVAKYLKHCLTRIVTDFRRQNRMARMTGRISKFDDEYKALYKIVINSLIEDGLRKEMPVVRIDYGWTPDQLQNAMIIYDRERAAMLSKENTDRICEEFTALTGQGTESLEHMGQLREAHLQALQGAFLATEHDNAGQEVKCTEHGSGLSNQPAAGRYVIDQDSHVHCEFKSNRYIEYDTQAADKKQNVTPLTAKDLVLTKDVEIIHEPLTLAALNQQFKAAECCNETLYRSPKTSPYGVDIAGACERSIKVKMRDGKIDQKTADSYRARLKLFCLLTNVQTVTELEPFHINVFLENLDRLPVNFNRSVYDANLELKHILARAETMPESEVGRSPSSVNGHLDAIGSVLTHAISNEKSAVDKDIKTSLSRRPEQKRGRKRRNAFQRDEITRLFQHPVWTGCQSSDRRHQKGNSIEKDGLFWVPLIAYYTGGRMEEIAGLTVDAIVPTNGHYGFDIRPNEQRRLKNLQSERSIPVHQHLIKLGLLEHLARMKSANETYLFPELLPTSAKKKFLSSLTYNWKQLRDMQLNGNPRKLDGHSLRHSFNQTLKLEKLIAKDVRLDILGHAGIDLNDEVYGDADGMPFELKKEAIDLIPWAF